MTLESVLARLRLGAVFEPFDCHATFDARRGIPGVVGHACHSTGKEFEGGLALLPRLDVCVASTELFCDGGNVEDVDESGAHGDNDFAWRGSHGMWFAGKGDNYGLAAGLGEVVEVEGAVPRGGDKNLVLGVVDDAAHGLGMFANGCLLACVEVDPEENFARQSLFFSVAYIQVMNPSNVASVPRHSVI